MIFKERIDKSLCEHCFDNLIEFLKYKVEDQDIAQLSYKELNDLNMFSKIPNSLKEKGFVDAFIGCSHRSSRREIFIDFALYFANYYHFFQDLKSFKAFIYDIHESKEDFDIITLANRYRLDSYKEVVSYTQDKDFFYDDNYFHYVTMNINQGNRIHESFIFEDEHNSQNDYPRDNILKLYIEDQIFYDLLKDNNYTGKKKSVLGTNARQACIGADQTYEEYLKITKEYCKKLIIFVSDREDKYLIIYPEEVNTQDGCRSHLCFSNTLVQLFEDE